MQETQTSTSIPPVSAADITIIGAGLLGTRHLGQAAVAVLRAARLVFCSAYNTGMAEHVRALNPRAIVRPSEENEYRVGMYRPDMYRRMASAVLDAAHAGPGVAVLCPGSAVVVDLVAQFILQGARDAGLRVDILPGISSIEAVLAEVGYDVSDGLQVVIAQKLVLHRLELNPSIASIVLQPAYFDTLFYAGAPHSTDGRYELLQQQLARTLSPEAPMALVITPTDPDESASVFWFRLGSFGQLHRVLSPRHTLFVPPQRPAATDPAFASRIASWHECLARIEVDGRGMIRQQKRSEAQTCLRDLPPGLQAEAAALAERWRLRSR
jgi:precorrin-6B methylase 1